MSRATASQMAAIATAALALQLATPPKAGAQRAEAEPYRACRASAEVSPRVAFVGQQLRYVARIVRDARVAKVEWIRPPSFPDFRAERLPGHSEDTAMTYRGVTYMAREEHRAIHPRRTGRFTIPAARLRCTIESKGRARPEWQEVETPALEVDVRPLPEEGRPAHFAGLVGRARLQIVVEPRTLTLGETVSLSVGVLGAANVWVLTGIETVLPLSSLGDGVDVFAQPSSLDLSGGDELVGRRFLRAELVPRRAGALVVPGARLAVFDPRLARYEVLTTEPITIEVTPREALPSRTERPPKPAVPHDDTLEGSVAGKARAAIGVGLLAISVALLWPAARRLERWRAWRPIRAALDDANGAVMRAEPVEEAAALERALRAALALRAPDLGRASADEIRRAAERRPELAPLAGGLLAAADELDALAAARFSGDPAPCERGAIDAALEALRSARRVEPRA